MKQFPVKKASFTTHAAAPPELARTMGYDKAVLDKAKKVIATPMSLELGGYSRQLDETDPGTKYGVLLLGCTISMDVSQTCRVEALVSSYNIKSMMHVVSIQEPMVELKQLSLTCMYPRNDTTGLEVGAGNGKVRLEKLPEMLPAEVARLKPRRFGVELLLKELRVRLEDTGVWYTARVGAYNYRRKDGMHHRLQFQTGDIRWMNLEEVTFETVGTIGNLFFHGDVSSSTVQYPLNARMMSDPFEHGIPRHVSAATGVQVEPSVLQPENKKAVPETSVAGKVHRANRSNTINASTASLSEKSQLNSNKSSSETEPSNENETHKAPSPSTTESATASTMRSNEPASNGTESNPSESQRGTKRPRVDMPVAQHPQVHQQPSLHTQQMMWYMAGKQHAQAHMQSRPSSQGQPVQQEANVQQQHPSVSSPGMGQQPSSMNHPQHTNMIQTNMGHQQQSNMMQFNSAPHVQVQGMNFPPQYFPPPPGGVYPDASNPGQIPPGYPPMVNNGIPPPGYNGQQYMIMHPPPFGVASTSNKPSDSNS